MPAKDKDAVISPDLKKDIPLSGGVVGDERVSSSRRNLIKASAAAIPAVMTLRSGAAAAAARTSMGCRDNDANRAAENPPDSVLGDLAEDPAHDEWLRVPAKTGMKVTAKVQGEVGDFYLVETTASTAIAPAFDYFNSAGTQIDNNGEINSIDKAVAAGAAATCYYVDNNGWTCTVDQGIEGGCNPSVCTESLPTGTVEKTLAFELTNNTNYKVVQLLMSASWSADGTTAYLTYYPQMPVAGDSVGAPITDSCWCSVSPDMTPMG